MPVFLLRALDIGIINTFKHHINDMHLDNKTLHVTISIFNKVVSVPVFSNYDSNLKNALFS